MKYVVVLVAVFLAACSGGEASVTSQIPTAPSSSVATSVPETTVAESTTTTAPPPPCPAPPYEVGQLPTEVVAATDDLDGAGDEFATIGGTRSTLWAGPEDKVAIALIRGALPPNDWPADKGEVEVAGSRAVAGPYPDGRWVVAWFNEPGDRCDQYTMVFYPPVSPEEVEETLASMVRVAG